jgi:hypothetical protein
LFFLGQDLYSDVRSTPFHIITPSLHCGTFVFYLSFARVVLNTHTFIPNWDGYMLNARKWTVAMAFIFLLVYVVFGIGVQSILFLVLGFSAFVFTLISYYHFYKIKNKIAQLFLLGSFLYSSMAIFSFFAGFSFGGYQGFIDKFNIHPTIFMYAGSLFEAVVFSILIGNKIASLEKEKKDTLKQIERLKQIVIKNHIVLKDKTKVYISDLIYLKADDHYLNLSLSDGKSHFVRGKLKNIKEQLPPNFTQSHRSYIVNSNFIKQVNRDNLIMINQEIVPLSRSYKDNF